LRSIVKRSLDRQTTLALEFGKPGPRHENVRGAWREDKSPSHQELRATCVRFEEGWRRFAENIWHSQEWAPQQLKSTGPRSVVAFTPDWTNEANFQASRSPSKMAPMIFMPLTPALRTRVSILRNSQ
jgi:hypothetical protein